MIRLDALLREAWERRRHWSAASLAAALECIGGRLGARVQWDPDAAESWGCVIANDRVEALLRSDCPLAFVMALARDRVASCLAGVVVVAVESMEQPVFAADRELLEQLCAGPWPEEIDTDAFTLDELWWATS